ncbi:MAG TPA: hypothetical protein PLU22_00600 [Polyangiaceae bacterium]|nr:hypothetical protein [Polyangiaceae bacterium]
MIQFFGAHARPPPLRAADTLPHFERDGQTSGDDATASIEVAHGT